MYCQSAIITALAVTTPLSLLAFYTAVGYNKKKNKNKTLPSFGKVKNICPLVATGGA